MYRNLSRLYITQDYVTKRPLRLEKIYLKIKENKIIIYYF